MGGEGEMGGGKVKVLEKSEEPHSKNALHFKIPKLVEILKQL